MTNQPEETPRPSTLLPPFYDEHGGMVNRALSEEVRAVMQRINDCTPGTRLAEVPTLFAFGPIYAAIAGAVQAALTAERGACAAIAERVARHAETTANSQAGNAAWKIYEAIVARGDHPSPTPEDTDQG